MAKRSAGKTGRSKHSSARGRRPGDLGKTAGSGSSSAVPSLLKRIAPWILLLTVAVTVSYIPAIKGGFIWDDPEYVINNPTLRSLEGLGKIWFGITQTSSDSFRLRCETPQYYPLVFTTFWIEYHLWELDPMGYHIVNMLLHATSALLLWLLLARLSVPGAFAAALIFALHPVNVESVAWVTERKNVLSLLLYLLSASAYLRFALPNLSSSNAETPDKDRCPLPYYCLALVLFICALLSKTVTCTLPAALALILLWKKRPLGWRDLTPLVPFFAFGILLGLNTVFMERTHVGAQGEEWSLTFLERCLLAGRIPWFYAWKLVWPLNLVFIYPRWEINAGVWWQYLFPAATCLSVLALWLSRRRFGLGPLVAVLFFLGTLVPALGFFNVYPMRFSYVADHFQYLAGTGLITLIASSAVVAIRRLMPESRLFAPTALATAALFLGCLTWNQGAIYKDQVALWRDTLAKNPSAWIAHSNLAEILVAQGDVKGAIRHCTAALKLKPDLPEAHGNLANAYYHLRRYDEAMDHYEEVLRLEPENVRAMNNMAATLEARGDLEGAVAQYHEAIRVAPDYANAHYNLANTLRKQGKIEEAVEHYTRAVDQSPEFVQARLRLGVLLKGRGDRVTAAEHLRVALDLARDAGQTRLVREIKAHLAGIERADSPQ